MSMKPTLTIAIVIATCFTSLASLTVTRSHWHYCNKCHVLFFSEGSSGGVCAAGGTHQAQGFEFQLPFNGEETKTTQTNWRLCRNCHAMFYNGFPNKRGCPAGGAHAADSKFPYSLAHDVPETARAQSAWRFCNKCNAMFYDGFPDKGHCAAGGAHVPQGFNFVLEHGSAVTEAPAPPPNDAPPPNNTPRPIRHLGKITPQPQPPMHGPEAHSVNGQTADQYQQEFNKWTGQGFIPTHINVACDGSEVRYSATFQKIPNAPACVARHNIDNATFQKQNATCTSQGYKLKVKSSCNGVYAAIWQK